MVFHDVSQERRLQRALTYQATHDQLTGLINRREFETRLAEALQAARAGREAEPRAACTSTSTSSRSSTTRAATRPATGCCKQVTSIVQTRIRTTDTLARLGGDEFGVLLQDCSLESAQRTAEGLRQAIRDFRFVWQDRIMNVGVSIGLAEINGHADTLATVMSAADVACYSAKDSGRNRVQTYKQGRAPERMREMQWVSRINRACEEDQLVLLAQPIVPIRADVDKLQALRAAAADAGRERRARPAVRVHPGRGALQPDAGRRPLGRAAGLLAPRAPAQRSRHARTVHAVDQHLGHDAERRAVPRLRARRDGGCGRERRARCASSSPRRRP